MGNIVDEYLEALHGDCKVKRAFNGYITRVTKIYNETKDVYRCSNMKFNPPKCDCKECTIALSKLGKG